MTAALSAAPERDISVGRRLCSTRKIRGPDHSDSEGSVLGFATCPDAVEIPDPPRIPGLSYRRFRDKTDVPVMAEIMRESRDADSYDFVETAEDVAQEVEHRHDWSPQKDLLFVDIENETVGFARCLKRTLADQTLVYEHQVNLIPKWRVHGLRRSMLRWSERRARESARGQRRDGTKVMEVDLTLVGSDLRLLVEEEGYRPVRHLYLMVRTDLDQVRLLPPPAGIDVRPVGPGDQLAAWRAAGDAFREEPTYDDESWSEDAFRVQKASGHTFQPDLWQIAWAGNEIVGGVFAWVDDAENEAYARTWGYTGVIFTRRDWRNRGLASALVTRAIHALRSRGVSEVALVVDADNPSGALRLYKKLGYRIHTQYARYRKPLD